MFKEFINNMGSSIVKFLTDIENYFSSANNISDVWPAISAGAAVATALWALFSWRVSKELAAIERNRFNRESASLSFHIDPEEKNKASIGFLFNDGNSATRVVSAKIAQSLFEKINGVDLEIGSTDRGLKTIYPGESVRLILNHDKSKLVWDRKFSGKCVLIIRALHQEELIVLDYIIHRAASS